MIARMRTRLVGDAGVSLVEMIVVMMLSMIVMTIAGTMFVTVAQQTVASEGARRSTGDASNIMNAVSTTIRASVRNAVENSATPDPSIVKGTAMAVTVISYTDAGPSFETPLQLRYTIDPDGRLVEDRWNPNIIHGYAVFPDVSAPPNGTRILGNVVVNAANEPLFRYFKSTGEELFPTASGLSLIDRGQVVSVRIHIKVRAIDSDQVVELYNDIGMPNMNLDKLGSAP
jgi:hypothetical protein